MNLTGILLCGGKSSRMGEDKGLIPFKGKIMASYPLDVLEAVSENILISSHNTEYQQFGYTVIPDEIPEIGPIGGLYSCMKHSTTEHFFVASCDIPFVTKRLAQKILGFSEGYSVVIPQTEDNRLHPLFGYYSRDVLPLIEEHIKQGNFKMMDLLKACNAYSVPVVSYQPSTKVDLLKNINSKEEIE